VCLLPRGEKFSEWATALIAPVNSTRMCISYEFSVSFQVYVCFHFC